jgi:hypothetical protein
MVSKTGSLFPTISLLANQCEYNTDVVRLGNYSNWEEMALGKKLLVVSIAAASRAKIANHTISSGDSLQGGSDPARFPVTGTGRQRPFHRIRGGLGLICVIAHENHISIIVDQIHNRPRQLWCASSRDVQATCKLKLTRVYEKSK